MLKSRNTKKFKIVQYIIENPGKTRNEINLAVLKKSVPGYYTSTYGDLRKNNIILSSRKDGYKITHYGLSIVNSLPHSDSWNEKMEEKIIKSKIAEMNETSEEIKILTNIYSYDDFNNFIISEMEPVLENLLKLNLISYDRSYKITSSGISLMNNINIYKENLIKEEFFENITGIPKNQEEQFSKYILDNADQVQKYILDMSKISK